MRGLANSESRGCPYEAIRIAREGPITKSLTFLPDRSCACLPRPDQVSAGFFGFRYLGKTFGYGRRWRFEVITLLADPSLCSRSSSLAFSIANSRVNFAVTCSWSSHRSSMAIDFKSLFSIGPTIREAVCHHRGDHDIDLNSNSHATHRHAHEYDATPKRDVT